MTQEAPNWYEPVATARREAQHPLTRGLTVRPTVIGFEGDEPTLYVRSRLAWHDSDAERSALSNELLALPLLLELSRLLIVSPGRLLDSDLDDPEVADALAERAVTVDIAERDDHGQVTTSGHALPYTVRDDGQPTWDTPIHLPGGGPWSGALRKALTDRPRLDKDGRLGAAGFAYALSRSGVVVAVAPGWRSRYGFDQPVRPGRVRSEDRRRAQRYARQPARAGGPA
jgi:hypothetical protein